SARPIFNFDVPVWTSGACARVVCRGFGSVFGFIALARAFILSSSYRNMAAGPSRQPVLRPAATTPTVGPLVSLPSANAGHSVERPRSRSTTAARPLRSAPPELRRTTVAIGCAPHHRRRIGSPVYTRPRRWPPRGGGFAYQAPRAALRATKSPLADGSR